MESGVQKSVSMRYTVFLRQHDGQHYAVVPLLPACSAQGRTREEVLHNVKVAIEETLANMEITTVEVRLPSQPAPANPWLETAGIFHDDPLFDEMLAEVAAYHRALDAQSA
jgi:predicted RNase H-like HicB family nuclease